MVSEHFFGGGASIGKGMAAVIAVFCPLSAILLTCGFGAMRNEMLLKLNARVAKLIFDKSEQAAALDARWVVGEIFGLQIPADAETLIAGGTDFLTRAFHASGALAANNRVSRIVAAKEFIGGGTGKKLLLTVCIPIARAGFARSSYSSNFPGISTTSCGIERAS